MLTRRSNDDLRARGDTTAISSTNTFGNVLGLSWLESPLAALTSCSEVHEEFENGDRSIRFIDHRLVFDTSHSPWRVTDREMRHDGQPGDGLGCAPSSFASRSLTAIDAAVPAADAAFADPAGVSATGLHRIFGGRLEEELNQIVAMLNETRSKRVSDRVFRSEVIGLDPAQPDFMVVVSVCSYYPDGVVGESATGEKTTIAGYEPGTSEEDWLYVWLEPILHGNAIVAGIEPGKSRDCWEQQ